MSKKMILLCILLTMAGFLFWYATLTKQDIGDGGFISGDPCSAPCFLGVIPDITNESQLEKIINASQYLRSCNKYDFTSSGGTKGYSCANANFSVQNGEVNGVGFFPSSNILVRDLLLKHGKPDRLIVFEDNLPDSPEQTGTRLLYDALCMEIYTEVQDGNAYDLTEKTKVTKVVYLGRVPCQRNRQLLQASDWEGYGVYSIKSQ